MDVMAANSELVEAPLTREELGARYRELCDDRRYENLHAKIEIDSWGRLLMSPPSVYHAVLQGELCRRLGVLGGQVIGEVSVLAADRVMVADAAWASGEFMRRHGTETPLGAAPEICVEVVSPSNSRRELKEKIAGYLAMGAVEVWIVYPKSRRIEFFGKSGAIGQSQYAVDLSGLFGY